MLSLCMFCKSPNRSSCSQSKCPSHQCFFQPNFHMTVIIGVKRIHVIIDTEQLRRDDDDDDDDNDEDK